VVIVTCFLSLVNYDDDEDDDNGDDDDGSKTTLNIGGAPSFSTPCLDVPRPIPEASEWNAVPALGAF